MSIKRHTLAISAKTAALVCGLSLQSLVNAQDHLDPIYETLPYLQKMEARQAAPAGQDAPLDQPAIPVQVSLMQRALVQDEPALEDGVTEIGAALTLEEDKTTQVIEEPLKPFGYEIFQQVPTTFAPITDVPVPPDYQISIGDTLVVQLYGKRNVEYKLVVTREGRLLIPEYGPLDVAGLSFAGAQDLLKTTFEKRLIGTRAVVTMGELRTLQVRVTGDVVKPGVYTISPLSTLVDALMATGGIKKTGSLRHVLVKRSGKIVTDLDLYALLLKGNSAGDVYLKHNDVIFVPPIGDQVFVGGEVQRPAIYELLNESTVGQVLELAGGLTASASLADSFIERVIPGRYRTLVALAGARPARKPVVAGDFLRILPVDDTLDAVVMLSGHVKRPGGYELRSGMRIADLMPNPRLLLPNADIDFALLKREEESTRRTEVIYIDLSAAMRDPSSPENILLHPRDELVILNLDNRRAEELAGVVRELDIQATDYRPASTVTLMGHTRFGGRMPLEQGLDLVDVLSIGGGIIRGTDMAYSVIARTRHPSGEVVMRSVSLGKAITNPNGKDNPEILPGDRIYLFNGKDNRSELMRSDLERISKQGSYQSLKQIVWANGKVNHPGQYPLEPGMRASDLLCAARGLQENAYGVSAELTRYQFGLGERREVDHWALDTQHMLRLCDSERERARAVAVAQTSKRQQERGAFVTSRNDKFSSYDSQVKRDWESLDAMYYDDHLNPLLLPDDQITFVDRPNWVDNTRVTLTGEIMRPGLYVVDRGETLCSVMQRAGGVTSDAYLRGAVFTRQSILQQQQETLAKIQNSLDDLLVDLSLSHSFNNADKTPAGEHKSDYMQVIKQLEAAEPSGRMVIDLERAMSCDERYDVILEDGDQLVVGIKPHSVYVAGQVYVPTSHVYHDKRDAEDYLKLSGGPTVLGREKHAYVIGPNGEVLGGKGSFRKLMRSSLEPGSTLVVPLDVDRMNGTEKAQSWTRMFAEVAVLAGIVL